MMRGSTRRRRQSQLQKHQGHVWPQKQHVKGQGLTQTDACSWMGDANDSDSLVLRYRKNSTLQLSYTDRYICSLMSVIVFCFFQRLTFFCSIFFFFFFTLILDDCIFFIRVEFKVCASLDWLLLTLAYSFNYTTIYILFSKRHKKD